MPCPMAKRINRDEMGIVDRKQPLSSGFFFA